jgi:general secretion pathway protein D
MAELLRDVFQLRQQGSLYVLVPSESIEQPRDENQVGPAVPTPVADGLTRFTPVPDERQQLAIAIDARTNTLIVSGTDEYLVEVGKLVEKLDSVEAEQRSRIVYHLSNAKAAEVEATLTKSFKGESDLQRSLLGDELQGAALRQLEQEVTVVGDEKTNKLIVTVSPRYEQKVLELIQELDASPPQVVIQVLLAEVTVDEGNTWGTEFRVRNITGESINFRSLAAGATVASALGIPNLQFASADFELLVRALEAQGKLQVLSRPSVTVNNNEAASINVGDDIAIVTNVERSDTGRTNADVERRETGIKLNVTPSISADGFVRMEIEPEISALSQRTTQISQDFQAPIVNQRKMKTTVTIKDGQTVVIGGLIQTRQQERDTHVPVLGYIPVVGALFSSTDREESKTELVVILTPRVIYNDSTSGPGMLRHLSEQHLDSLDNAKLIRNTLRTDRHYDDGEHAEEPPGAWEPPEERSPVVRPGDPVPEPEPPEAGGSPP